MTPLPKELEAEKVKYQDIVRSHLRKGDITSIEIGQDFVIDKGNGESFLPASAVEAKLDELRKKLGEIYYACNDERIQEIQQRLGILSKRC